MAQCVRCGKAGIFLLLNEDKICRACIKQQKINEENARIDQENREMMARIELRKKKIEEANNYYEILCDAFKKIENDYPYPQIAGLSEIELEEKYNACSILLKQLPLWESYELFPNVYLEDCVHSSQNSFFIYNPRLPFGHYSQDKTPDFTKEFKEAEYKLLSISTKFMIAESDARKKREKTERNRMGATSFSCHVAGTKFREKEIISLGVNNADYESSKRELVELGMIGEKIWKYKFYYSTAQLVPEPENKHDPNAIKVVISDVHVGYIPANECTHLLAALQERRVADVSCVIGGGPFKVVREEYDYEKDKEVYYIDRDTHPYSVVLGIEILPKTQ